MVVLRCEVVFPSRCIVFLTKKSIRMDILSPDDLVNCKNVARRAAEKAGAVIRDAFYKQKTVHHKGAVDLVTETDKACEDLIFSDIKEAFPSHKFIGEEGSSLYGTAELSDEPTWMVDPLDGTTNFVHQFPFVCVCIGLTVKKQPILGVVYNPILNEMFVAVKGEGAFLNDQRIHVSDQTHLGNALVASEIGTTRDTATVNTITDRLNRLLYKVRSLRLSGSCAMNMVGVAMGRLDAFFEIGFGGPWDVAAAAVIVEEAGGKVFDPSGAPFDVMSRRVAATNAHLVDQFVEVLAAKEP